LLFSVVNLQMLLLTKYNCTPTNANEVGAHFVILTEWLEKINALAISGGRFNLYEQGDMHKSLEWSIP
jgi:hypothetical protein